MSTSTWINIIIVVAVLYMAYRLFAPAKGLSTLSPAQFKDKMKEGRRLLIDVREKHEFARGHIPGAKNMPLSELKSRIAEIPSDTEVLLYCQSGMRSRQAGRMLSKGGHRTLSHLRGGVSAWDGKLQK